MKWKAREGAHKYNEDKLSLLTKLSKLTHLEYISQKELSKERKKQQFPQGNNRTGQSDLVPYKNKQKKL